MKLNAPYFDFDVPLKTLHLKEKQDKKVVAVPLWIDGIWVYLQETTSNVLFFWIFYSMPS